MSGCQTTRLATVLSGDRRVRWRSCASAPRPESRLPWRADYVRTAHREARRWSAFYPPVNAARAKGRDAGAGTVAMSGRTCRIAARRPRRDAGNANATSARERDTGERRDAGAAASTCRIAARRLPTRRRRSWGCRRGRTCRIAARRLTTRRRRSGGSDRQRCGQRLPDRGRRLTPRRRRSWGGPAAGGRGRSGGASTCRIAAKRLRRPTSRRRADATSPGNAARSLHCPDRRLHCGGHDES